MLHPNPNPNPHHIQSCCGQYNAQTTLYAIAIFTSNTSPSMFTYGHSAMEIIPRTSTLLESGKKYPLVQWNKFRGLYSTKEWTLHESQEKNGHSTSGLLYKRVWGRGKKWPQYIRPTLQESLGEGKKMATVHRAYFTREWYSPEGRGKWFWGGE